MAEAHGQWQSPVTLKAQVLGPKFVTHCLVSLYSRRQNKVHVA